jgi:hypothetical protein
MKGNHPNYPIEISDADELDNIRNLPMLHYRLVSNISLKKYDTGRGWTPIGSEGDPFLGSLDGGGFKITELYINSSVYSGYMGLFGYLTGIVSTLGVETAAGWVKGGSNTGAIAGYVGSSTIKNCVAANSTITGNSDISRVVGYINRDSGSVNATVTNNFAKSGMTAGRGAFDTTAANYGVSKSLTALQTKATYSGTGFLILYWQ